MNPGGGSLDDAVDAFLEVGPVAAVLRESGADAAKRAQVADAVREAFRPHVGDQGLRLDSAVWLATARAPSA